MLNSVFLWPMDPFCQFTNGTDAGRPEDIISPCLQGDGR